jgi:hypothetical protein
MKTLMTLSAGLLLSLTFLAPAHAQDEKKKELTPQQQRMSTCSKDAKEKGKTGDDRKAYMKACLAGKAEPEKKLTPQQEKMAACNKDAADQKKTGDARKAFMKECLAAH